MVNGGGHPLPIGQSSPLEWSKVRHLGRFEFDDLVGSLVLALDNRPLYILKLKQRSIFDLVDLNSIVLHFPQFK